MDYRKVAASWLSEEFDAKTREEVKKMMEGDEKLLEDAFYRTLEFGTGGLRGVMGAGTNRMNKYTVGMATQGLANYLVQTFPNADKSVVISYDSRNNSKFFADVTADVLMQNGIKVFLFDDIRPTPELSFAIRHLHCTAGIMITASHNPKEYNGYKVFWEDGAQITAPHDTNIIAEVAKITEPSQVKFGCGKGAPQIVGEEIDEAFISSILTLTLSPESVARHNDIKLVYTPLHGTGIKTVPVALKRMGFKNLYGVDAQNVADGNFPTVVSPNPEEPTAMKMAMERADEVGASIVLASDPDADRVGCAVRDSDGKLILLTGNQIASILTSYMLTRWGELGKLGKNTYMVKTIVTTELMKAICDKYSVKLYNVLTGFKYIAEIVRLNEGKGVFIGGGEESNGFNCGEFVRDKDSTITCALIAECAAWLADSGKTIYEYLGDIYAEYGIYREKLVSITKKGKEGLEEIAGMMKKYREEPPVEMAGKKVVKCIDYTDTASTGLPKSNVLQFFNEDGAVVTVRPSGTEPKIKFYFGAHGDNADEVMEKLLAQFAK